MKREVDFKVILGVTGSIAAYKALELLRRLKGSGVEVRVVMTRKAKEFVAPLSFETLSGYPVFELFQARDPLIHLSLAKGSVMTVAPATANILGKVAAGIADDLLTTLCLTVDPPIIFAPAMDLGMWQHPVVKRNVRELEDLGHIIIEPEYGELASGAVGRGRLAKLDRIYEEIMSWRARQRDFTGIRALVSLGRIESQIDPVRVVSNRSSGRMGYALVRALRQRGAEVIMILGNTELEIEGAQVYRVDSAQSLKGMLAQLLPDCDLLFMTAAVADYQPVAVSRSKRKEEKFSVDFTRTEDILAGLGRQAHKAILVGFSVETDDPVGQGLKKLEAKNLDMLIVNPTSAIGADRTQCTLLFRAQSRLDLPEMAKSILAHRILDEVKGLLR
jgi:phosphopantothenoylcysteine decarboxylase/phosphopantothenate--cysteine ligase